MNDKVAQIDEKKSRQSHEEYLTRSLNMILHRTCEGVEQSRKETDELSQRISSLMNYYKAIEFLKKCKLIAAQLKDLKIKLECYILLGQCFRGRTPATNASMPTRPRSKISSVITATSFLILDFRHFACWSGVRLSRK